jgi:hypothetical protein
MKLLFKTVVALCALVLPAWSHQSDFTGIEIILPDGFQFVSSDPGITVDGSGKQLAARASGGVTLSIRHDPAQKFLTSGIAGFLEEGKNAMAGQSLISMRSSTVREELGRIWGVAVIDARSGKKHLVQLLLITSFRDTMLMFEFQGPKKREKFIEAAARDFMISNPFKVVAESGSRG